MWWSGRVVFLGLLLTLMPFSALTQVPNLMTYQGRVRSNGTNYTGEGQFKFALIDAGTNTSVQATAIAHVSGGAITSIGLLNPGSGYTSEPVITISDSTGSGAILKAEISGGIISSIEVSAAGHSYTSPTLLIAPPPANLAVTSFWSNDDTSTTGDEPVEHVIAPVEDGFFTVVLGRDMSPLRHSIFTNAPLHLRVWFNDGASGFQQLSPDQQLTSTPYAMMSALVEDGSVTGAKLAPGAVEPTHLSSNALATVSIPDHLELGDAATHGSLDVFHNDLGGPSLSLDGETTRISGYGDGGRTMFDLTGFNYGHLTLFNQTNPNPTVVLTGVNEAGAVQDEGVGALYINATDGTRRARLTGLQAGGRLELFGSEQTPNPWAYLGAAPISSSTPGGLLQLRNQGAQLRMEASAEPTQLRLFYAGSSESLALVATNVGGQLRTYDASGKLTSSTGSGNSGGGATYFQDSGSPGVRIDGLDNPGGGGVVTVYRASGGAGVHIDGERPSSGGGEVSLFNAAGAETVEIVGHEQLSPGGQILLKRPSGVTSVEIDGQQGAFGGSLIKLNKADGSTAITLDSEDAEGNGRVITQVLEITGGSDLSEQFDIVPSTDGVLPGMVVCIDPDHPGRLKPCAQAYDRTVAGVVSGAGGVRPGMLMGQAGSLANGSHPVALTGRVFCWVDASYGAVRPGDMITTSETPGHGMIVQPNAEAHGAVLGKAMTALKEGKGLVLLLVSLQ